MSWRAVEEALTSLEMKEAAQKIKEKYLEDKGGGVVSEWVWEGGEYMWKRGSSKTRNEME